MHTVRPGIWWENWKSWKMRNIHCRSWNMARNTQKREKWDIHTVGPGLWRENWNMWKMRHGHCRTWNMARNTQKFGKWEMHKCTTWSMARKLKIIENEKYTCRTWIMARKVKYFENETQTLFDLEVCWETLKKVENEKCTLQDLEYGEKHSKMWNIRNAHCRTWSMARKLKNVENETQTL